jgi:ABC-type multidrug transport system permease subunit
MRGSLFTGFLTVGSFLLSLKAFIVVKLKENIFDTDGYKNRLKERRRINQKLTLYGPVKRLSHLLFISISSSIAASVSQFSIGLIPDWKATFVCIFLAIFAISMLISTLLLIKGLLDEWLNYLEDAHDKTVENSK